MPFPSYPETTRLRRALPGLGVALLALCAAGAVAPPGQDAQAELKAIEKELQQEFKELRNAIQASAGDDAASDLRRDFEEQILPEFAARYAELARANARSPVALEAWNKVLDLAMQGMKSPLAGEALTALTTDHIESEKLAGLVGMLRYSAPSIGEDKVVATLRTFAERSPHRSVQAAALLGIAGVLSEERAAGDPKLAEARTALAKLSSYGDVEERGRTYADAAAAFLFAMDNLVVGKPCPDFSAVDAEGAQFKLSDYAGKVVLIDFWGFW